MVYGLLEQTFHKELVVNLKGIYSGVLLGVVMRGER